MGWEDHYVAFYSRDISAPSGLKPLQEYLLFFHNLRRKAPDRIKRELERQVIKRSQEAASPVLYPPEVPGIITTGRRSACPTSLLGSSRDTAEQQLTEGQPLGENRGPASKQDLVQRALLHRKTTRLQHLK